jgi:hypothetical protein
MRVPREMVSTNTRETRESWFVRFDVDRHLMLQGAIPVIPNPEPEPVEPSVEERKVDLRFVGFWVALFVTGMFGLTSETAALAVAIPIVFTLIQEFRAYRSQAKAATKVAGLGLLAVGALALPLLARQEQNADGEPRGPWHTTLLICLLALIVAAAVIVIRHIMQVKEHNQACRNARGTYRMELMQFQNAARRRENTLLERDRLLAELSSMTRPCLDPVVMAQLRLDAMNRFWEMATAELNVPLGDANEIWQAPGQRFLEIMVPIVEPPQFYPRPLVRVPLGLGPSTARDTPIVRDLLAHRYKLIIALIIPQGLGIVVAQHDCVEQTTVIVGHDLVLWKSISRVTRQNAAMELGSDEIVLETFGGSRQSLPVNGDLAQEYLATVPQVRIGGDDDVPDLRAPATPPVAPVSSREVNAFVREIQMRMSGVD